MYISMLHMKVSVQVCVQTVFRICSVFKRVSVRRLNLKLSQHRDQEIESEHI